MVSGTIKVGKNTAGHFEALCRLWYKAELSDNVISVIGTEFIAEIDLRGDMKGRLKEVVAKKALFTYETAILLDGKTEPLSGIFVGRLLGEMSCLIVKAATLTQPVDL